MTRRLLVIGNDKAGGNDRRAMAAAVDVLRTEAEVEVVETASMDDLRSSVERRGDAELVVAGGDGSLHAVLTAMCLAGALGEDAPVLGLLPLGTGNDFARAVDIPTDPVVAARIVLDGPARPIDVLQDEDSTMVVNAVHIGVGEEAGRLAEPWKERLGALHLGVLGYLFGGVGAMLGWRGRHLEVVADGETLADGGRRVLQVAVTIGTSVGGGTRLAPDAEPGDGLADVVVSYAVSPLRRIRYALHLSRGNHTELDDVVRTRAREVTVRGTQADFGVDADGELDDPVREQTWRVLPGAYALRAPTAAGSTSTDVRPPDGSTDPDDDPAS